MKKFLLVVLSLLLFMLSSCEKMGKNWSPIGNTFSYEREELLFNEATVLSNNDYDEGWAWAKKFKFLDEDILMICEDAEYWWNFSYSINESTGEINVEYTTDGEHIYLQNKTIIDIRPSNRSHDEEKRDINVKYTNYNGQDIFYCGSEYWYSTGDFNLMLNYGDFYYSKNNNKVFLDYDKDNKVWFDTVKSYYTIKK